MTPRRETCRWVRYPVTEAETAECGAGFSHWMTLGWTYCPHCGGRIVRDQPEEGKA